MQFNIIGTQSPVINMQIGPNDEILAEAGKMLYKSANVEMTASMQGGLVGAFKRALVRETIFLTKFKSPNGPGVVAFAPDYPGTIDVIDLAKKGTFILQKDAFVCGESPVDIGIVFTKRLGAGLFGGEGFILEKVSGGGKCFIHAGGDLMRYTLKEGQELQVDPGCFVGCDTSVKYDTIFIRNIKTALFGGEGAVLLSLSGPGEVILQSLPIDRLMMRINAGSAEAKRGLFKH